MTSKLETIGTQEHSVTEEYIRGAGDELLLKAISTNWPKRFFSVLPGGCSARSEAGEEHSPGYVTGGLLTNNSEIYDSIWLVLTQNKHSRYPLGPATLFTQSL